MSAGSITGKSTLSTAFWGSWLCPGVRKHWCLLALPLGAFLSINAQRATSAAFSPCSVSRSSWERNGLLRELNRSLTLGDDFPWARKRSLLFLFSFSFILNKCRKDPTGMVSKQDLIWWWFFCLVGFRFFSFSVFLYWYCPSENIWILETYYKFM